MSLLRVFRNLIVLQGHPDIRVKQGPAVRALAAHNKLEGLPACFQTFKTPQEIIRPHKSRLIYRKRILLLGYPAFKLNVRKPCRFQDVNLTLVDQRNSLICIVDLDLQFWGRDGQEALIQVKIISVLRHYSCTPSVILSTASFTASVRPETTPSRSMPLPMLLWLFCSMFTSATVYRLTASCSAMSRR